MKQFLLYMDFNTETIDKIIDFKTIKDQEKIDRGLLLIRKEITVYKDDTLVDLHVRIQNLEQSMMIESLDFLKNREEELPSLEKGSYHKSVPEEMEKTLMEKFKEYKNMRGV